LFLLKIEGSVIKYTVAILKADIVENYEDGDIDKKIISMI
jgi:hypothetical protein